jgi:hypothetical protein
MSLFAFQEIKREGGRYYEPRRTKSHEQKLKDRRERIRKHCPAPHFRIPRRGAPYKRRPDPDYKMKIRARNLANMNRDQLLNERCPICGSTDKLEMHHDDYDQPLNVTTFCTQCHDLYELYKRDNHEQFKRDNNELYKPNSQVMFGIDSQAEDHTTINS